MGRGWLAWAGIGIVLGAIAVECGDSSSVKPGETREFAVVFRVDAAGLRGLRQIALEHRFEPAAARP